MKQIVHNMLNKIKKTGKDQNFWIFMLVSMVFFGVFIKLEYATDTYYVFATPKLEVMEHFMSCGRFVTAFVIGAVGLFNIEEYVLYICSFLFGILCITLTQYKLFNIIRKRRKK